jgi:biopolymer transport protein ExbD
MPIKQPETDESVLNMTPMIDIVFNLVTFFMIAVDISHKDFIAVALPRAHAGVEDEDPATKGGLPRFNIGLTYDGEMVLKNNKWNLEGSPTEQQAALDGLRNALSEVVRKPGMKEPDGSSRVVILIRGDREAKWKYVQWIMQVAAEVKIYQMHFAVESPPADRPGK